MMLKIRYIIGKSRSFATVDSSQPRKGCGGLNSHSFRAAVRSVFFSSVPSHMTIRTSPRCSGASTPGASPCPVPPPSPPRPMTLNTQAPIPPPRTPLPPLPAATVCSAAQQQPSQPSDATATVAARAIPSRESQESPI